MPLRACSGVTAGLLAIISIASLAGCSQTSTEAKSPTPAPPVLEFVAQFGVRGGGPGQLSEPVSIATDPLGNVYIADAGSQFIHKFDWQGTPLLSFTEDALKHPQWIAVDSDGDIYVSDPVRASVFVIYPGRREGRPPRTALKDPTRQGRIRQRGGGQRRFNLRAEFRKRKAGYLFASIPAHAVVGAGVRRHRLRESFRAGGDGARWESIHI